MQSPNCVTNCPKEKKMNLDFHEAPGAIPSFSLLPEMNNHQHFLQKKPLL